MLHLSHANLPALVLHANGTNRDHEAAQALESAGARPEIVHLNQLRRGERNWDDFRLLVLPGGFSYGDALGAGRLLALDLQVYFADAVRRFIESGRPVIGICNGFQALVKAGLLPDPPVTSRLPSDSGGRVLPLMTAGKASAVLPAATLTFNAGGHFECRWVILSPRSQRCIWTRGLDQPFTCPVAHGEGRFVLASETVLNRLQENDQIALVYAHPDGNPARGVYPQNPNGSAADIAGVSNYQGNVLGLMPHPEDHIFPFQHPRWTRARHGNLDVQHNSLGLSLFINGVRYAGQI